MFEKSSNYHLPQLKSHHKKTLKKLCTLLCTSSESVVLFNLLIKVGQQNAPLFKYYPVISIIFYRKLSTKFTTKLLRRKIYNLLLGNVNF